MTRTVTPEQVRQALTDGGEVALLDVRERGRYARGHLFLAVNLPLSGLELNVRRYVPRYSTRVLLCDGGEGLAQRAAGVMEAAGYADLSVVEGGVHRCMPAGFELFRGHYAVPYAFGLYVARHYGIPQISPQALRARMDAGESMLVLDSRREDEFFEDSIPGAVNLPLAELPYRIKDLATDPETSVIVHCGAVTRGMLGGQSLIEAGLENPVAVLTNGVRGWALAGYPLDHGRGCKHPRRTDRSAAWAAGAAHRLAAGGGARTISPRELDRWRVDDQRTLYIVDVRTREEFESGHLHDARWVPGGELVGLYEDHIGTRNARLCLVDDNGVRAALTASWLTRMGWPDVAVLEGGIAGHDLEAGHCREPVPDPAPAGGMTVSPGELAAQIGSGDVLVLDFADSLTYGRGHVPGAWWALRSNLPDLAADLPGSNALVTTCPDGRLAALAATDLRRLTGLPTAVLAGGTGAWQASGRGLVAGLTRTLGTVDDVAAEFVIRPGDDPATQRAARRRMVCWQEDLLDKLARDRTYAFPVLPPAAAGRC